MRSDAGLLIANLTPFRPDLSVDWDEMARRTQELASIDGVRGFLVNAFAAEAPALSPRSDNTPSTYVAPTPGGIKRLWPRSSTGLRQRRCGAARKPGKRERTP